MKEFLTNFTQISLRTVTGLTLGIFYIGLAVVGGVFALQGIDWLATQIGTSTLSLLANLAGLLMFMYLVFISEFNRSSDQ